MKRVIRHWNRLRGDGVTIPAGDGISACGLMTMVVLGWWLDPMILEVFSNGTDCIIL